MWPTCGFKLEGATSHTGSNDAMDILHEQFACMVISRELIPKIVRLDVIRLFLVGFS